VDFGQDGLDGFQDVLGFDLAGFALGHVNGSEHPHF
jgi:hypothetical protein